MVTKRNHKPAGKAGKKIHMATVKPKARSSAIRKVAKPAKRAAVVRKPRPVAKVASRTAAKPAAVKQVAVKPVGAKPVASARSPLARPASVKTAAKAVAAARANAKRRAPSYIPRSSFGDDWKMGGPIELPRQPAPAAHTPTRKPPKPRAPKPKAISHEQAVANLKALLESRKRKDRGGDAGAPKSA